ncbi:hypothetical protein [Clostridium pasteurianum]|uniref:Uncharacterized protein n=1 Tax=Clostridium pasteurianum BC1 TaxID=86416 RepID=R4K6R9_CLOPA|nr:hypothetical protein [Clostridium pasteurianum]AGK97391.1 hypothetical protein Clopa_2531 [Clostridium pasteurianum BC1]
MRFKCNCGKEVNLDDIPKTLEIFDYLGTDEKNNPIFKCKKCGVIVSG